MSKLEFDQGVRYPGDSCTWLFPCEYFVVATPGRDWMTVQSRQSGGTTGVGVRNPRDGAGCHFSAMPGSRHGGYSLRRHLLPLTPGGATQDDRDGLDCAVGKCH